MTSILQQFKDQFLTKGSADHHNWEKAAAFLVSKMGDDSIRDNTQSHYGNLYYIQDQLDFARAFNKVLELVKEQGYQPARVEVTGGANVLESIRRMAENPFDILDQVRDAMPNARLGMLLRARQGTFYAPIPEKAQEDLVDKFMDKGVTDFSVFDMLNDQSNLKATASYILKKHIEQRKAGVPDDKLIRLELCQSYITEPLDNEGNVKKAKVWGNTSFANGYVSCIKELMSEIPEEDRHYIDDKALCLKNKDYAGLLNTERLTGFMNTYNDVLGKAVANKEIPFMPKVIIHSHGEKPEMMANAFAMENIEYVDTGVGALSGGNAHGNMVNVLKRVCEKAGVDFSNLENTEVYKAIRETERAIAPINEVMKPMISKGLPWDTIDKLRMAGGGIAALDNIIKEPFQNGMFTSCVKRTAKNFIDQNPEFKGQNVEIEAMLHENFDSLKAKVYELIPELWEIGGRFHTVTPGAKILSDATVMESFSSKELEYYTEVATEMAISSKSLTKGKDGQVKVIDAIDHVRNDDLDKIIPHLVPTYKMIMKGRFGDNKGVEILGLQDFRDAILVHDFVKEAKSSLANEELVDLLKSSAKNRDALDKNAVDKSSFYKLVKDNPDLVSNIKANLEKDFSNTLPGARIEELKLALTVTKINETMDQYLTRINYEKNVATLLEVGKDSKKWTESDIRIMAYDPTAVNDIKNALLYEKGEKLPITSKVKSRDEIIMDCTIKLVEPKQLVGQIVTSRSLKEGTQKAMDGVEMLFANPGEEVWRRTQRWMQEFPEHITSVITANKEAYIEKVNKQADSYRKELIDQLSHSEPQHLKDWAAKKDQQYFMPARKKAEVVDKVLHKTPEELGGGFTIFQTHNPDNRDKIGSVLSTFMKSRVKFLWNLVKQECKDLPQHVQDHILKDSKKEILAKFDEQKSVIEEKMRNYYHELVPNNKDAATATNGHAKPSDSKMPVPNWVKRVSPNITTTTEEKNARQEVLVKEGILPPQVGPEGIVWGDKVPAKKAVDEKLQNGDQGVAFAERRTSTRNPSGSNDKAF